MLHTTHPARRNDNHVIHGLNLHIDMKPLSIRELDRGKGHWVLPWPCVSSLPRSNSPQKHVKISEIGNPGSPASFKVRCPKGNRARLIPKSGYETRVIRQYLSASMDKLMSIVDEGTDCVKCLDVPHKLNSVPDLVG